MDAENELWSDQIEMLMAQQVLEDRNQALNAQVQESENTVAALELEIRSLEAERDFEREQFDHEARMLCSDFQAVQQPHQSISTAETQVKLEECLEELRTQLIQSNNEIFVTTLGALSDELHQSYDRQLSILRRHQTQLAEYGRTRRECRRCGHLSRKIRCASLQLQAVLAANSRKESDFSFFPPK